MFYHVAKGRHSSADDGRESRISRDGRASRVDSDDGRYTGAKRSRTPSTFRGGYLEDGENDDDLPFDEALEEEELDEYIYVPQTMLGHPLKDFDSEQENVSRSPILFTSVNYAHLPSQLRAIRLLLRSMRSVNVNNYNWIYKSALR